MLQNKVYYMVVLEKIILWVKHKEKRNIFWRSLALKYRVLRKYFDYYVKDMFLPRHIQIEPTTNCNCNCIICIRKTLDPRLLKKDLSLGKFKRIISQIPSLKAVQLQGIGEPLLCKDLEAILEFGVSKNIVFTTNSNATILDDYNISLILRHLSVFCISFDSVIKENFEKIRVGADFDKVLHNIKMLAEKKKETGSKTRIVLYFVVTHLNYNELPLYFDLCEALGAEAEVRECMNWLWATPEHSDYFKVMDFIRNCGLVRDDIKKIIKNRPNKIEVRFYQNEKAKLAKCYWPFSSTYITAEGFVTPCCMISDPQVFDFGNIFEKPFQYIWNSKEYKYFRKTHILNLRRPLCERCSVHTCIPDL